MNTSHPTNGILPVPAPEGALDEISALVATLHETEQRLEKLTGGEVDAVADSQGRPYLLRRAQEQMRYNEAGKQAAILNALPAHIALLNSQGMIISVNESWRRFAVTNVLRCPDYAAGINYLEVCDNAHGDCSDGAHQAAEGIRAVLAGNEKTFSIEYPCHSPGDQRWFQLTVTPLANDRLHGAVVMHLDITQRRQVEQALKEAKVATAVREGAQRYSFLADSVPLIIWTARPDGGLDYYNKAWFDYTGLTLAQTRDWGWGAVLHPDDLQRCIGRWTHSVTTGESYEIEYRFKRMVDGAYRWFLGRASACRNEKGEIVQWVGTGTDIDDQKRAAEQVRLAHSELERRVAERTAELSNSNAALKAENIERERTANALRASEAEFRTLAEAMPQIVWVTRPDGQSIYINPQWSAYTGLASEQGLGLAWIKPLHPEDQPRAQEAWQLAVATTGIYFVECRMRRADGMYRWWLIRGVPQLDEAGNVLKWFGTCTDIHDLKLAELEISDANRALHRQQTELRALFDLMPAMIWFKDTKNNILRVNQQAAHTAGKPVEEIEGKSTLEIYPQEADKYYADDLEVIRSGLPKLGIVEPVVDRRKNELWIQTDKVPVCDSKGKVIGLVVMAQDITERKRSEEALRTTEIQLRQSQKMDAIGQLAGGVAHDFNNLLTVILGRAELLMLRSELAEPVRRSVNLIHQTGMRAAVLTRQLLQFSRQQILQTQVLDVNALVSGMQELLRRLISEDISLVLKFNSKAVSVKADPGQVEQVIMNLVINARDAMPNGGCVTIETANVELDEVYCRKHEGANPGPHVMLAVSDSGCGMSEAVRARIFEPFFTTKEKGKGTGLGLSTVYGIVKQAGGSIYVYSEVKHGTVFKVYLPEINELVTSKISSSALLPVQGGGETILLAEDEDGIRELLNDILTEKGYTVLQATNGEHALQWSERHKGDIQLLLTDVVMPKVNGKDVAQKILRNRPELRVIFMSGYTSDAIVSTGVLDDGIEFLEKPFTPASVVKKVREVLDRPAKHSSNSALSIAPKSTGETSELVRKEAALSPGQK